MERLPARTVVLYGTRLFDYRNMDNERHLLSQSLPRRVARGMALRGLKLPESYFEKAALRGFLREKEVHVVLAEYGPTGVAVSEVCKEAGIPLVVHFHGYDAYDERSLEEEGYRYPELFENAAAVIAVSRDMERQLLHLGAKPQSLHYNPYGVDTSLFQHGNPSHTAPLFVAVGRFVDKKAPHLTVLAFKRVVETFPEARLIMIGGGPLWEASKLLCRGLDIAEAVDFPGPRPHVEVASTMRQALAFVQHSLRTSYGDSEGTPVAVLEAGATGLPVVATRHAGIQDIVIDGKTGLLVDEGDVDSMAECMIRLVKDRALAADLGRAARERICAEFSMEKSISHLWSIIEAAIQEHRKS
jgi:glycosyltransferase involved in cell wall biosynthesis